MSPKLRAAWIPLLLAFAPPAFADEADPWTDPRLGGKLGRLRYRVARHPAEEVEVPDVLVLKDGRSIEAYFLEAYGDRFVFYVKESQNSWLKEELPRSEVALVDLHQYLPQDPVQPRRIEPAAKQPVPKDDILHGVFTASRGRQRLTSFEMRFVSETDKVLDYTEDATDFGIVELESRTSEIEDRAREPERSHRVCGTGRYYLYAPGSVNNEEWVLILSRIVLRETDRGRETTLYTAGVPDETFILYFSPEKDSFRLEWSNVGEWTWGSLTNMTFRRAYAGRGERPGRPRAREAQPGPGGSRPWAPRLADDGGQALVASAARAPAPAPGGWKWRTDNWTAPKSRFGGR